METSPPSFTRDIPTPTSFYGCVNAYALSQSSRHADAGYPNAMTPCFESYIIQEGGLNKCRGTLGYHFQVSDLLGVSIGFEGLGLGVYVMPKDSQNHFRTCMMRR